jgi:hypothetical protein
VPVPAGVLPDLVLIQPGLPFRGLERFFDGPTPIATPATRSQGLSDKIIIVPQGILLRDSNDDSLLNETQVSDIA